MILVNCCNKIIFCIAELAIFYQYLFPFLNLLTTITQKLYCFKTYKNCNDNFKNKIVEWSKHTYTHINTDRQTHTLFYTYR